jgi:hypothetical protein
MWRQPQLTASVRQNGRTPEQQSMNAKSFFRLLLIAPFFELVVGTLVPASPYEISENWRTISEWHGNGGFYEHLGAFASSTSTLGRFAEISLLAVGLLLLLTVYVGLFLFWRPARLANLLLTLAFLVSAPWAGLVVLLPVEAALYGFTMLCEGAVVALCYTSPIKNYFEGSDA